MRCALLAFVVVLVAGCGAARPAPRQHARRPVHSDTVLRACTVYRGDGAVYVTFAASDAEAACRGFIVTAAKQGRYWTEMPQHVAGATAYCELTRRGALISVFADSWNDNVADRLCAAYVAAGFTDVGTANGTSGAYPG